MEFSHTTEALAAQFIFRSLCTTIPEDLDRMLAKPEIANDAKIRQECLEQFSIDNNRAFERVGAPGSLMRVSRDAYWKSDVTEEYYPIEGDVYGQHEEMLVSETLNHFNGLRTYRAIHRLKPLCVNGLVTPEDWSDWSVVAPLDSPYIELYGIGGVPLKKNQLFEDVTAPIYEMETDDIWPRKLHEIFMVLASAPFSDEERHIVLGEYLFMLNQGMAFEKETVSLKTQEFFTEGSNTLGYSRPLANGNAFIQGTFERFVQMPDYHIDRTGLVAASDLQQDILGLEITVGDLDNMHKLVVPAKTVASCITVL